MQKKTISQNGLKISTLGFGCMGISEFYGLTDETEAIATLEKALELGITHFDTADVNFNIPPHFAKGDRYHAAFMKNYQMDE